MEKKYQIIYADPPWAYKQFSSTNGIDPRYGSVLSHYQTMTIEEICKLPVTGLSDVDCALFMWITMPNLDHAFEVINAWGFEYKTVAFVWIKMRENGKPYIGLGHWTRANAELCLLATKGHAHRINNNVSQIVMSQVREHSRKPDVVRDRIVELMGDLPRIELFARQKIDSWDIYGNQAPQLGWDMSCSDKIIVPEDF